MKPPFRALLAASCLSVSCLATTCASAGPLLWQSNSLTYLYGKDYKIDPSIQQTLTFEHASGWSLGDLFIFVDSIHFNADVADDSSLYGEISPRLSFGKLLDTKLQFGPVKDVLLAATYEFGEDDVEAWLLGPGFDLEVPGFDYFSLNVYQRQTKGSRDGDGVWQITPVWSYTIPLGRSDLLIDGYMDWVVDNDKGYHANLHFNPQIKYDLGKAMAWGEKQFYVGIEYDYWKNKYGIDDNSFLGDTLLGGTDQSTASLLLKAHF